MYTETPLNFNEISSFVIHEKNLQIPYLTGPHKLFFYDACAFQRHAHLAQPEPIFSYIKSENGLVVLTRCILMELTSESNMLCPEYIEYIRCLHHAGIPVLLLNEEDLFFVFDCCFSSTVKINSFLSWAISTVHRPSTTITATFCAEPELFSAITNRQSSDRMLFRHFFQTVRKNKTSGDNLGEELLTICVHLLSNLPSCQAHQYLILTEDKGAVRIISKAAENSSKQLDFYAFSALTTTRLAQHLYDKGILTDPTKIRELLVGPTNAPIKFFGSGAYDLAPLEKKMSAEDLSLMITIPGAIYINY